MYGLSIKLMTKDEAKDIPTPKRQSSQINSEIELQRVRRGVLKK